jgi:hypothetical protein
MIDIILSHWAIYLLLGWLVVIAVIGAVNLWPSKKSAGPPESPRFALRGGQGDPLATPFKDDFKLPHRDR